MKLENSFPVTEDTFAIIILLTGPFIACFGEKLRKPTAALLGFITGSYLAIWLMQLTDLIPDGVVLLIASTIGIICALLLLAVIEYAVYILAAIAGALLGNLLFQMIYQIGNFDYSNKAGIQIPVMIFGAIVAAVIARFALKFAFKVVTAILGGFLLAAAIDHWGTRSNGWKYGVFDPSSSFFGEDFHCTQTRGMCAVAFSIWGVMTTIGLIVQFNFAHKLCGHPEEVATEQERRHMIKKDEA